MYILANILYILTAKVHIIEKLKMATADLLLATSNLLQKNLSPLEIKNEEKGGVYIFGNRIKKWGKMRRKRRNTSIYIIFFLGGGITQFLIIKININST